MGGPPPQASRCILVFIDPPRLAALCMQKLKAQIEETERMRRKKEKEARERSLLDEKLLKTIPLVNEANAMADELGKGMVSGSSSGSTSLR